MQKPDNNLTELARLKRKLTRETRAREEAERLLEEKSEELYETSRKTQELTVSLQAAERDAVLASLGQAIAHDLNNLIAAISGYARLLETDLPENSNAMHRAKNITQAAEQAAAIVETLDQVQADTLPVRCLNLSDLMTTSAVIAEGLRPDRIRLLVDIEPMLKIVSNDVTLSRFIVNCLKNAFEAIKDNGTVVLWAGTKIEDHTQYDHSTTLGEAAEKYSAIIEIRDTGIGMDAKTLNSAFNRDFTTKDALGGKGLGLQSIKRLSDAGLAHVQVDSTLGRGSRFRLCLKNPNLINQETSQKIRLNKTDIHSRVVMIVDDDPLVGDMLEQTLIQLGYEAYWYEFPHMALADIDVAPPDILITDFNMPEMGGTELIEKVKVTHPELPIIILSGQAASIPAHQTYDALLKKPVSPQQLSETILSLLA